MKKTKIENILVSKEVLLSIDCDICGTTYRNPEVYDNEQYDNGFDEIINLNVSGGYGSNFIGDGTNISLNICERCFVNKILKETKTGTLLPTFSMTSNEIKNIKWKKFVKNISKKGK